MEAAFAAWRLRPRRLVGVFPLLLEADAPGGPVLFRGERHAIERGQYNAVEPGAAFMDSQSAFAAYYSDALAEARAMVDEKMNCDDILLNMALANATAAALAGGGPDAVPQPAVQWLRPERRLDLSRLSGVGEWPAVVGVALRAVSKCADYQRRCCCWCRPEPRLYQIQGGRGEVPRSLLGALWRQPAAGARL